MFRAAGVTAVREIVAGAAFFGAFEMGMQALQQNGHQQDSNSNDAFAQFLCGGTGGVCRWVASIPIDTVKTVMQTHRVARMQQTGPAVSRNRARFVSFNKTYMTCDM